MDAVDCGAVVADDYWRCCGGGSYYGVGICCNKHQSCRYQKLQVKPALFRTNQFANDSQNTPLTLNPKFARLSHEHDIMSGKFINGIVTTFKLRCSLGNWLEGFRVPFRTFSLADIVSLAIALNTLKPSPTA